MAQTAIKISVIGTGFVGSTVAYTLVMKGIASEIILVDANPARAEGEAMDISHGAPFAKSSIIKAGSYEDTKGSDVVIITAGTNQKPGETRMDLITRNAAIMREVAAKVAEQSPNAVILVISNPVDVMAYIAREVTGFPKHRVIGSGTVLDSSRFRYLLAHRFDVDPRNVHGYIMGEHGDTEFPAWSLVNIAGMSIDEASELFGQEINDEIRQSIADATRNAAYEIINRKGATYYGIAMSATRIVEAIVRDERSIMTVSSQLHGEYDIDDLYLSVPAILGEHGVEKILTPHLSDLELENLHRSADALREARSQIQ